MARVLLIAGNGAVGARTAARLAAEGVHVCVHHTGRRPVPASPFIEEIRAARAPGPILALPEARADVAVHFHCMGAPDAAAFVRAYDGAVARLALVSSCDVYRAYGRFLKLEPGPPDPTPLAETAPLREFLYPYRARAANADALEHWYDKIDAERALLAARSEVVILRLPKVYGADTNGALDTVYGFAGQPHWRWTHGHADNVAAAIALAALHPRAAGEAFNLGEAATPTMGERLALLPACTLAPAPGDYDFAQDMHCDTSKVRALLGYRDVVDEVTAMRAVACG